MATSGCRASTREQCTISAGWRWQKMCKESVKAKMLKVMVEAEEPEPSLSEVRLLALRVFVGVHRFREV